jgi:hypothetical protein
LRNGAGAWPVLQHAVRRVILGSASRTVQVGDDRVGQTFLSARRAAEREI